MIIPEAFGPLTIVSLVFAILLIVGAASDLALWFLIDGHLPDLHGGLRRAAILMLSLVGLLSVIGSVSTDDLQETLRVLLGTARGAATLIVWTLVVYDLVRYFEYKQQEP